MFSNYKINNLREIKNFMTKKVNKLKVKIFADGADLKSIYDLSNKKYIE